MQCYNRQTVLERTISEAASLNCPADDGLEAMVDCLRTVHPDDLFDSGISPPDDPMASGIAEEMMLSYIANIRVLDGEFFTGTVYEMLSGGAMQGIDYMGGNRYRYLCLCNKFVIIKLLLI